MTFISAGFNFTVLFYAYLDSPYHKDSQDTRLQKYTYPWLKLFLSRTWSHVCLGCLDPSRTRPAVSWSGASLLQYHRHQIYPREPTLWSQCGQITRWSCYSIPNFTSATSPTAPNSHTIWDLPRYTNLEQSLQLHQKLWIAVKCVFWGSKDSWCWGSLETKAVDGIQGSMSNTWSVLLEKARRYAAPPKMHPASSR